MDTECEDARGPRGSHGVAKIPRQFLKKSLVVLGTLVLVAVLAVARSPSSLQHPQPWAEDATVFLKDAREVGGGAIIMPYQGYLHLIPRIIAAIGRPVPLADMPLFFNCFALLALVGSAAFCLYARIRMNYKPLLALALVMVPHGGEVFLNITNIQWITACILVLLIVQGPAETAWQFCIDLSVLAMSGLTGPFIVLLAPFFVARFFRFRNSRHELVNSRYELAMMVTAVLLAGVQARFLLADSASDGGLVRSATVWHMAFCHHFLGSFVMGDTWDCRHMPLARWVIAPLLVFVVTGIAVTRRAEARSVALTFLMAGLLIYLAGMWRMRSNPLVVHPFAGAQRYLYIPYVFLMWTFIVFLSERAIIQGCALAILAVATVASLGRFTREPYPDFHWREHAARVERGERIGIPINPPGWSVDLGPRTTTADHATMRALH